MENKIICKCGYEFHHTVDVLTLGAYMMCPICSWTITKENYKHVNGLKKFTCTEKERKFLDLLIGQPDRPSKKDGDAFIKLMNEIRLGEDNGKN